MMISIGFLEDTIYNVEGKFCKHTASPFTLLYTVQVLCAIYVQLMPLVSVYFHSHVRAVSCLVLTDCQSNALTPSICSMVTSLMDVMTYVAVRFQCYLCGHLYSSVKCVLFTYTQYTGHCQDFCIHIYYNTCYYIHACNTRI